VKLIFYHYDVSVHHDCIHLSNHFVSYRRNFSCKYNFSVSDYSMFGSHLVYVPVVLLDIFIHILSILHNLSY
jgi:hypothetical protein